MGGYVLLSCNNILAQREIFKRSYPDVSLQNKFNDERSLFKLLEIWSQRKMNVKLNKEKS